MIRRRRNTVPIESAPLDGEGPAGVTEQQIYPGYADHEWRTQNAAVLGDELGKTAVPEEKALADGAPPAELIEGEGEDLVGRARGAALDDERALTETSAEKPFEQAEHERSAARHAADERDHVQRGGALGEERKQAQARYERLESWQKSTWLHAGAAALSKLPILGSETLILVLAYTFVPGTIRDHWLTAGFVAVGIAGFTNVLGWVMALGWEELPARFRGLFWLLSGLALAGLFGWMVSEMGAFRAEAFQHLLDGDVTALDPTFITQLQLLLAAAAALSAMRLHLSQAGRELQQLIARLAREQAAALGDAAKARALGDLDLQKASAAAAAGAAAEQAIPYVKKRGETTVESIRGRTRFTRGLLGTMFLRRRNELPPDLALVVAEQRFKLRRGRDLAVLLLGSLAFLVALVALALGSLPVTLIALAVTLGHAGIGLLLHLRELRRPPESEPIAVPPIAGPIHAARISGSPSSNGDKPAKGVTS